VWYYRVKVQSSNRHHARRGGHQVRHRAKLFCLLELAFGGGLAHLARAHDLPRLVDEVAHDRLARRQLDRIERQRLPSAHQVAERCRLAVYGHALVVHGCPRLLERTRTREPDGLLDGEAVAPVVHVARCGVLRVVPHRRLRAAPVRALFRRHVGHGRGCAQTSPRRRRVPACSACEAESERATREVQQEQERAGQSQAPVHQHASSAMKDVHVKEDLFVAFPAELSMHE